MKARVIFSPCHENNIFSVEVVSCWFLFVAADFSVSDELPGLFQVPVQAFPLCLWLVQQFLVPSTMPQWMTKTNQTTSFTPSGRPLTNVRS